MISILPAQTGNPSLSKHMPDMSPVAIACTATDQTVLKHIDRAEYVRVDSTTESKHVGMQPWHALIPSEHIDMQLEQGRATGILCDRV